eukprot:13351347-Alexandrium_andersonii.AAC.1
MVFSSPCDVIAWRRGANAGLPAVGRGLLQGVPVPAAPVPGVPAEQNPAPDPPAEQNHARVSEPMQVSVELRALIDQVKAWKGMLLDGTPFDRVEELECFEGAVRTLQEIHGLTLLEGLRDAALERGKRGM